MLKLIKEKLAGYKTYVIVALWLVAEVANLTGVLPWDVNEVRVLVFPLLGLTLNAKLNRTLS